MLNINLEIGALTGFREYLANRGIDPDGTPGIKFTVDGGYRCIELSAEMSHHLADFIEYKSAASIYN